MDSSTESGNMFQDAIKTVLGMDWKEEITARNYLFWFTPLLLLLGIAEGVVSIMCIGNGYGYFAGAIYTAFLCILTAIFSIFIRSRLSVVIYHVFISLTFLLAALGAVLSVMNFLFVGKIKACASTNGPTISSCGFNSPFECYGDSSYFLQAANCEGSYDNSHKAETDHCSCVIQGASSQCYYYSSFNNCNHLLDDDSLYTPLVLSAAFALAIAVVSGYTLFLTYLILYNPAIVDEYCWWVNIITRTVRTPSRAGLLANEERRNPKNDDEEENGVELHDIATK
jgi:hypothetical protein